MDICTHNAHIHKTKADHTKSHLHNHIPNVSIDSDLRCYLKDFDVGTGSLLQPGKVYVGAVAALSNMLWACPI